MSLNFANLVYVATATTGTGSITLGSALSGYRDTSALTDATDYSYAIRDGANYETGHGTFTAAGTTLTRTVYESSNSNAAINLSGNAVVIVADCLAQDLALLAPLASPTFTGTITLPGTGNKIDASGNASLSNLNVTGSIAPTNGVFLPSANILGLAAQGSLRAGVTSAQIYDAHNASGMQLSFAASSSTVPTIIPNRTATTTGFGGDGTNLYGIIGGTASLTIGATGITTSNLNVTGSTVPTNGMYLANTGIVGFSSAGAVRMTLGTNLAGSLTNGPNLILTTGSSATVPTLVPNKAASTTGIGGDGTNLYTIVAGSTIGTWSASGLNVVGTISQGGTPLGTAAFQNTGTSGANVPLMNGTNTWSSPQTISSSVVDPVANLNSAIITANIAATTAANAQGINAVNAQANVSSTNTQNLTGSLSAVRGAFSVVASAAGVISTGFGGVFTFNNASATATVTTARALFASAPTTTGGGAISFGATAHLTQGTSATNNTTLLLASAVHTGNYAIYSEETVESHFAGGLTIGSPTGGFKGAATLNATTIYQNGTALATIATSGSGADLTANSVTNAKLATMAANTIRGAVSAGNVTDLTAAQVVSIIDGQFPKMRAHQTGAGQSITSTTFTKVTLDTIDVDTNSAFSSSRFTPTIGGYYRVTGQVTFTGSIPTTMAVAIYKNGAETSQPTFIGSAQGLEVNDLVLMNGSTDFIELYVFQSSGTTQTILTGSVFTRFMAERVP